MRKKTMTTKIAQAHENYVWGNLRIPNTRISIRHVWEYWKLGYSIKEIQELYPQLRIKEIRRAIRWYQMLIVDIVLDFQKNYPKIEMRTSQEEIDKIFKY